MDLNARHLRGSRNVIRLTVAAVSVALIFWLQMLKVPDPWSGDEPAPSRAAKQVQPTWTPPKETGKKINPGPFRLEIWRLERVLYSLDAKAEDGWGVEVSLQSLADSLLDYKLDEDKTRAGIALRRFAVQVGSEMDAPYNRGPRWPEWRQQWESLRRRYFLPADWYARIDPNGVLYSVPPGPV